MCYKNIEAVSRVIHASFQKAEANHRRRLTSPAGCQFPNSVMLLQFEHHKLDTHRNSERGSEALAAELFKHIYVPKHV